MSKMNEFDAHDYEVKIIRVILDEELYFKATVGELPDFELYETTADLAYQCTVEGIEALHAAAVEDGRPFPAPHSAELDNECTGRFTLRLPKSLHRRLVRQSQQEAVSLNTLMVSRLSETIGVKELAATLAAGSVRQVDLGSTVGVTVWGRKPQAVFGGLGAAKTLNFELMPNILHPLEKSARNSRKRYLESQPVYIPTSAALPLSEGSYDVFEFSTERIREHA